MKIRAVLFDIYKTLLEVSPPPADADVLWERLWSERLAASPKLTLKDFAAGCDKIIAREHAAARAAGVPYPEIYWPAVASEALPELDRLKDRALDEFLFAHAQLQRTVQVVPGALKVLQSLLDHGVPMGLVSNCQPYTLFELATALDGTGLSLASFQPDLCFLSYKHGFSKPDPHAFRLLAARLQARHILPGETLVVGDRSDNDIAPARAQGFRTWLYTATPASEDNKGDWKQLGEFLASAV